MGALTLPWNWGPGHCSLGSCGSKQAHELDSHQMSLGRVLWPQACGDPGQPPCIGAGSLSQCFRELPRGHMGQAKRWALAVGSYSAQQGVPGSTHHRAFTTPLVTHDWVTHCGDRGTWSAKPPQQGPPPQAQTACQPLPHCSYVGTPGSVPWDLALWSGSCSGFTRCPFCGCSDCQAHVQYILSAHGHRAASSMAPLTHGGLDDPGLMNSLGFTP